MDGLFADEIFLANLLFPLGSGLTAVGVCLLKKSATDKKHLFSQNKVSDRANVITTQLHW